MPTPIEDYDPEWGLAGGITSYEAWARYRRSGEVVLPFSGGWLEQPQWIINDFRKLDNQLAYFDAWARADNDNGR